MVELKDRLQRALGRGDRKISGGMVNGMYGAAHPRQPFALTSAHRPPASGTPTYYGQQQQDSFNPAVSSFPPRPTTPFQQTNTWGAPTSNFSSPAVATQLPPVPSPAVIAPPPIAPTPQQFQSQPPPPAASAVPPPPPTTGNVSRGGPLSQRARVYVQDPSVVGSGGSRSAGYFNPGSGSQFPGFTPQQPQSTQAMFQPPAGQYNTPHQQSSGPGGFLGNQFGATPALNSPFQSTTNQFSTPPVGPVSNGLGFDSFQQSTPALFNPLEHTSTPHAQGSFMQPPIFDASVPSVTPPPSGLLPTLPPTTPATSAPPGWNDPPPVTTMSKPKMEAFETISQPMPLGVVEQPAVPIFQSYDGTMMHPVAPAMAQQSEPEPEPVQPAPVLLPIPNEHLIIHDVFHTLKDKCASLANNAVSILNFLVLLLESFTLLLFYL